MSDVTIQITEYCLDLLGKQVSHALDAAPDYLAVLADQTNMPDERTIYLDTMHELSFARKKVVEVISSELRKPFDVLIHGEIPHEFSSKGGVIRNVTGASELEEKLALETMLNKARAKYEIQLNNVARSLDAMMGNDWVKRHYNPVDPEYMIRAWVAGTHEMQLDTRGFLGLYALLDSQLLSKLNNIYEQIGHFVEGLAASGSRPGTGKSSPAPVSSVDDNDFESMFGDIDDVTPDMAGNYSVSTGSSDSNEIQGELHTAELISKLSELQKDRSLDDSDYYANNYLMDYRQLLEDQKITKDGVISPWTIGQINDDIIDMTRLMFNFIMDDYNVPDDIRYHVSRLQIPYLKLGFIDKSLFQTKDHPGRLLLMDLTQAINTSDPAHTGGIDLLLSEIMGTINRILDTFTEDPIIFHQCQKQFKSFVEGDEHIDESMQERQQTRDTQFKRADNARLHIEATLADICNGKRVPPIIEKILDEYWSKALFLEYLKTGEEGEDYQSMLQTANILVESVQPKYTEEERKTMAKALPAIIKRLKTGLNTISVASFESVDLFRELQHCHMEVLKERPEDAPEQEFEVSEDAYKDFQEQAMKSNIPWDRAAIEASMLEENIERSITMSSVDPYNMDDNPNVIRQSKPKIREATTTKAERERQIIDDELREAREAYERALQEHKDKKQNEQAVDSQQDDGEDFMAMFFQDPDFAQKQADALKNKDYISSEESKSTDEDEMDEYSNELDISEIDSMDETSALSDSESDFLEQELHSDHKPISPAPVPEPVPEPIKEPEPVVHEKPQEIKASEEPSANKEPSAKETAEVARGRAQGAMDSSFNTLHDDKVSELIERLKVGLWVDLYHADGQKVLAKIMAIVPTVGKYIFGDRAGKKLADYNRESLYEAIKNGNIRLSEADTAYDKTLESVIANLRVMKKSEDN